MAPFAGVGVNVAMHDALELAHCIISRKDRFEDPAAYSIHYLDHGFGDSPWTLMNDAIGHITGVYESEMFKRAEKNAKETMMYLDLFFHERGGIAMVEHFEQVKKREMGDQAAKREIEERTAKYSIPSDGLIRKGDIRKGDETK